MAVKPRSGGYPGKGTNPPPGVTRPPRGSLVKIRIQGSRTPLIYQIREGCGGRVESGGRGGLGDRRNLVHFRFLASPFFQPLELFAPDPTLQLPCE